MYNFARALLKTLYNHLFQFTVPSLTLISSKTVRRCILVFCHIFSFNFNPPPPSPSDNHISLLFLALVFDRQKGVMQPRLPCKKHVCTEMPGLWLLLSSSKTDALFIL